VITTGCTVSPGAPTIGLDQQPQGNPAAVSLPPTWTPTTSPTASAHRPTATPLLTTESLQLATSDPVGAEQATRTPRPLPPLPTPQRVTAAPANTDFTGWQLIETTLAEFMLPEGFQVIDLGSGFSELFSPFAEGFVEGLGEFANEFAGGTGVNPAPLAIEDLDQAFAFDFVLALGPETETGVVLVSEPLEAPADLEQMMRASLMSMEGELKLLSWQILEDRPLPTGRILIEATGLESGEIGRALIFVFVSQTRSWNLVYQTGAEAFVSNLAMFERSAASFRIK
jgi:hypothetical protein